LLALHNERRRIFMQAAQNAMSEEDIQTVLQHPDADDKKTYHHNLLTTSFRLLQTLLYKEARHFAKLARSCCKAADAKLLRSCCEAGAKLARSWREAARWCEAGAKLV
jgi:hypothetical protein